MSPAYVLKRLALIVYTLFVVSLIVFAITQILPADAAVMLLGENATPDALAAVRERLGLDQPAWRQYVHWLGGVLHGDFGISMRTEFRKPTRMPVHSSPMHALDQAFAQAAASGASGHANAPPMRISGMVFTDVAVML